MQSFHVIRNKSAISKCCVKLKWINNHLPCRWHIKRCFSYMGKQSSIKLDNNAEISAAIIVQYTHAWHSSHIPECHYLVWALQQISPINNISRIPDAGKEHICTYPFTTHKQTYIYTHPHRQIYLSTLVSSY